MNESLTVARPAAHAVVISLSMLVVASLLSIQPANAFYVQVKPSLRVGTDCVGTASLLAPRLTACGLVGTRMRIWCPNGQMFEGATEQDGPAIPLERSLCNMTQVP